MKTLSEMTKAEIERLRGRQLDAILKNNQALIDAGYGTMRGTDIRAAEEASPGAEPLFAEYVRLHDAWQATTDEMKFRMVYHGTHHRVRPPRRKI